MNEGKNDIIGATSWYVPHKRRENRAAALENISVHFYGDSEVRSPAILYLTSNGEIFAVSIFLAFYTFWPACNC